MTNGVFLGGEEEAKWHMDVEQAGVVAGATLVVLSLYDMKKRGVSALNVVALVSGSVGFLVDIAALRNWEIPPSV